MQHLNEEQLVAFHYRDIDAPGAAAQHLAACEQCSGEYETIRRVLTLVAEAPVPERGESYGEEVWTRLRWKLDRGERRRRWQSLLAVAAMLAFAFAAGHFWRAHRDPAPEVAAAVQTAAPTDASRLLLVVVGDHLDTSGRVLLEVANAAPESQLSTSRRAENLVTANRIYRQTAARQGDEHIVQLLADLEPILLELANAGDSLEGKKLADLQKRIESKGLLFKVRVMSAPPPTTDTL
ncbi:MAG TPA: hypothetical protein VNA04_13100 [Thermoanaerobaculia bacterium]|nr:hypothetical protein [Thermoanaerobaculia bacterium]